jgi:hypothetical protein
MRPLRAGQGADYPGCAVATSENAPQTTPRIVSQSKSALGVLNTGATALLFAGETFSESARLSPPAPTYCLANAKHLTGGRLPPNQTSENRSFFN